MNFCVPRFGNGVDRYLILAFFFHVFVDGNASIDKGLLRKHCLENLFTIVFVDSMKVLGLDFFLSDDLNAIKTAQLRNVEENLAAVVLFVLNGIKTEV